MTFKRELVSLDSWLYEGDAVEVMSTLENESVDLVFADPPFNIGKQYAGVGDARSDYREWCATWIAECFRLLKPTGTFYLMTIPRHLEFKLPLMAQHGVFINIINWRNVSAAHNKRAFWSSTQPIIVYGKTKDYKFNTYAETRQIKQENRRWGGYSTEPRGQLLDYWDDIPFVYAGSIRHPEAIVRKGSNKKTHPAQMPIGLATRAILYSTDKDEVVLDPFMGMGTTGVACAQTGRGFIGIELSPKYYRLAVKRIKETYQQTIMDMMKEM